MIYQKITYKRGQGEGFRYLKNKKFIKEERVPQEVKDKLEYMPEFDYDDRPERRRCLMCEGPQTRLRVLNLGDGPAMVDLCEYHYFNKTLGKIAQYLREQTIDKLPEERAVEKKKPSRIVKADVTASA